MYNSFFNYHSYHTIFLFFFLYIYKDIINKKVKNGVVAVVIGFLALFSTTAWCGNAVVAVVFLRLNQFFSFLKNFLCVAK